MSCLLVREALGGPQKNQVLTTALGRPLGKTSLLKFPHPGCVAPENELGLSWTPL